MESSKKEKSRPELKKQHSAPEKEEEDEFFDTKEGGSQEDTKEEKPSLEKLKKQHSYTYWV